MLEPMTTEVCLGGAAPWHWECRSESQARRTWSLRGGPPLGQERRKAPNGQQDALLCGCHEVRAQGPGPVPSQECRPGYLSMALGPTRLTRATAAKEPSVRPGRGGRAGGQGGQES